MSDYVHIIHYINGTVNGHLVPFSRGVFRVKWLTVSTAEFVNEAFKPNSFALWGKEINVNRGEVEEVRLWVRSEDLF